MRSLLRTTKERTGGRLFDTIMSAATASMADVSRTDFTNTNESRDRNKAGKTDETAIKKYAPVERVGCVRDGGLFEALCANSNSVSTIEGFISEISLL